MRESIFVRDNGWLPKARILKVKAGPPGSRWRDNRPEMLVRRHHCAMDRNGSLSPSVISDEVKRRPSQNPTIPLPSSAFTHAMSSNTPRSCVKRGVSRPRSGRSFSVRRRHSIARKRDVQSQFDIRKYPAWFLTRSRIRARHSLTRNLEVLRKYVIFLALRYCDTKDLY